MSCDPFHRHDHAACHDRTLAAVDALCAERGLQFTPTRREVLDLLLRAPKALGAYDILAQLAGDGAKAPPVAYRALDFLVSNGFAHRLEKLNAYVACAHPGDAHLPAFLICRACDRVAEADAPRPLNKAAREQGFTIEGVVMEAVGLCPACADAAE
ncbi:transcriptional repressor [Maribius pontilimi]|uniref:Transcriptional repressor n=1 Tax=Palleronia pontilimi TaxID=1964209 RepID=A0A934IAJ0_9RHOB|nr:transcriptional repressor [Palleronia pontilimi]MBJ3763493.1 transcriptional repressor [Palleronia pontilimi]